MLRHCAAQAVTWEDERECDHVKLHEGTERPAKAASTARPAPTPPEAGRKSHRIRLRNTKGSTIHSLSARVEISAPAPSSTCATPSTSTAPFPRHRRARATTRSDRYRSATTTTDDTPAAAQQPAHTRPGPHPVAVDSAQRCACAGERGSAIASSQSPSPRRTSAAQRQPPETARRLRHLNDGLAGAVGRDRIRARERRTAAGVLPSAAASSC